MDNGSLPAASSPKAMDDTKVLSRRIPGQGETQEAVRAAPKGRTSAAGQMGERIPMETYLAPNQIRSWRPIWLWNPASGLLHRKEVCPFCR